MRGSRAARPLSSAAVAWRLLAALCGVVFVSGIFWGSIQEAVAPSGVVSVRDLLSGVSGPSRGFHARILSAPAGADVAIQGKPRGQTPFFGNVSCREGEEVVIEVSAKGFRLWTRNPLCREGGTLEITARLEALTQK